MIHPAIGINSVILSSVLLHNRIYCHAINRFCLYGKDRDRGGVNAALSRDCHRECQTSAVWDHYHWSDQRCVTSMRCWYGWFY